MHVQVAEPSLAQWIAGLAWRRNGARTEIPRRIVGWSRLGGAGGHDGHDGAEPQPTCRPPRSARRDPAPASDGAGAPGAHRGHRHGGNDSANPRPQRFCAQVRRMQPGAPAARAAPPMRSSPRARDPGDRHVRTQPRAPKANSSTERCIQTAMRERGHAKPCETSEQRVAGFPARTCMHKAPATRRFGAGAAHQPVSAGPG